MAKIRGLKRKYKEYLKEYKTCLANYDDYMELYVPQITYKENIVKSYQVSRFLLENTIKNIPSKAHYIYIFDENNALNNHLIIANKKELLEFGILKNSKGEKPEYIKNLEKNYNLKFDRYLATWQMNEMEYSNLDEVDKVDIVYIEKEEHKVIVVTNVLWVCPSWGVGL